MLEEWKVKPENFGGDVIDKLVSELLLALQFNLEICIMKKYNKP